MKKSKWFASAIVITQVLAFNAKADDTSEAIESLKKEIQILSQKVNDLEARQQTNQFLPTPPIAIPRGTGTESSQATVERAALQHPAFITAGADGFWLRSADTNFTLRLHGFAQVDGHYYASAAPAKDEFTIRRLRAIANGTVYHDYDYYVQTDFGSGISTTSTNNSFLQDAYLNVHYIPEFQVQAGKFKEQDGLEVLPLDEYLWFLERGLPSELAPNRNVGVDVHGNLFHGALSYTAAVFDGEPDGASTDAEVADNEKVANGRIFAIPFKNTDIVPLQQFGFGLGSTYGLEAGTATPSFTTAGRQTFFKYASDVSENGEHLRLDPQAYYFWGPLGIYGEYAISDQKLHVAGKAPASAYIDNTGWDIVGSYFLTGEDNHWGVLPLVKNPLRLDGSGFGALQLAARIGQLSVDKSAFPTYAATGSASGATSWSLSLNWYLNRDVKCIFEYSQTTFDGGSKTPGAVTGQNERALLGRLQFGF